MKKKLLSIFLVGCVTAAMLAGCGSSDSDPQETAPAEEGTTAKDTEVASEEETVSAEETSEDKKMIGIVPWDMAQAFEADLAAIAEEEIEARGWDSVVMDPKGDWAQMYTIIENLITQGVDGIIYTAIDTDGANDAVALAHEAGIPIVDFDCLASEGGADASVRYNDYAGGQMAAEMCMEALEGKEDANIIIFEEEPSIASSGLRVKGFSDWMDENYPNVTIVISGLLI